MEEQNADKQLEHTHPSGITGVGACKKCSCKGFVEDPTDPDECIGNRPPQGKCQHKKSDHR